MSVVVIIPTYNERDNIVPLLTQLAAAFKGIKNYTISYLVVDDTSPDGTGDIVAVYKKNHKNVHMIIGKKEGLGKALLRGMIYAFEHMGADIVLQIDADLSHNPKTAPEFLKAIDNGANFVVGSRYIKGGSIPENWGIQRKIYSILGNTIVRFGLGHRSIYDWTGGYRAYKKKFYTEIHHELVKYSGYVFQIAFLHKAIHRGAKVVEVPIQFTDRLYGHSKIAPAKYIKNIFMYIAEAQMHELFDGSFGKFLVVGTIGFIMNTMVLEVMVRFGFHPTIGSLVGAELAIVSNFILNNRWTFGDRRIAGKRQLTKFIQFNTASVGALLIQSGSVFVGTFLFGVATYRIFYIIGVGIGLIWNYIMYSQVIWKSFDKTQDKHKKDV